MLKRDLPAGRRRYKKLLPPLHAIIAVLIALLFIACGKGTDQKAKKGGLFTDITEESELKFIHDPAVEGKYFFPEIMCLGAALFDYDNDGDLDAFFTNGAYREKQPPGGKPITSRLFRQNKNGEFTDVTDESGLRDTGYGFGVAVGDIDNDGDSDVYITNYGPDSLYRSNGDGTFTNVSQQAGISNPAWSASATFLDYDRDGFLDIYVANYVQYDPAVVCTDKAGKIDYCGPQGFPGTLDVLYKNNGNGTFTDVTAASGIAASMGKGLGVVAGDFNGDHFPDLYVANDQEPNDLWINRRNGTFVNLAMPLGVAVNAMGQAEASMGVAVGDADGDGDSDLFMTHLRDETNTFYRFAGETGFQDDTATSGLGAPSLPYTGFGTGFFDYDQDGDLDVAVVNGRVTRGPLLTNTSSFWDAFSEPNLLFQNDGSGKFQSVCDQAGSFCTDIETSRALAFGDVDNDGDIDLLITNEGGPARLFRNDAKNKGNWLMVRAIDPKLKRDAVGARITVLTENNRYVRYVNPGYSYLSSNDIRVHFGLASVSSVKEVMVLWPDGTAEAFPEQKANQLITLEKGKGKKPQTAP